MSKIGTLPIRGTPRSSDSGRDSQLDQCNALQNRRIVLSRLRGAQNRLGQLIDACRGYRLRQTFYGLLKRYGHRFYHLGLESSVRKVLHEPLLQGPRRALETPAFGRSSTPWIRADRFERRYSSHPELEEARRLVSASARTIRQSYWSLAMSRCVTMSPVSRSPARRRHGSASDRAPVSWQQRRLTSRTARRRSRRPQWPPYARSPVVAPLRPGETRRHGDVALGMHERGSLGEIHRCLSGTKPHGSAFVVRRAESCRGQCESLSEGG